MIGQASTEYAYDISVIIPTYNRRDLLEETLEALEHQTLDMDRFEVVVINDGSTDDTVDLLERFKNRTNIHFTYGSKENAGQGIARNTAIDLTEGRVIVFIQDDIIPETNFLEEHLKVHEKFFTENYIVLGHTTWHKDLEMTAPMLFLEESGSQFKYGELAKTKVIDPILEVREATFKHFYTSNISIKKSLLLRERFDPRFQRYGWEDVELGKRLQEREQAIILYAPKAKASHYHPMSEADMLKRSEQIGKSAIHAEKINPRLKIVPKGLKKAFFFFISLKPIIALLKKKAELDTTSLLTRSRYWYYYALIKREFLKGMKQGQKLAKSL